MHITQITDFAHQRFRYRKEGSAPSKACGTCYEFTATPVGPTIQTFQGLSNVGSLSKLFVKLHPEDKLRRLVWQEIQLLSYFSEVDRQALRELHNDDNFLDTLVRFHSYECQISGSRAWSGGMAITPISLSEELAKRTVPARLSWLADYYQDYDRLLNGKFYILPLPHLAL